MTRSQDDAQRWTGDGTKLLLDAVAGMDEAAYDAPSLLPGWTRRHVVAHVAANADALVNLVRWAATGVPTPMYASPDARAAGIEGGLRKSSSELDSWLRRSAAGLAAAMRRLTDEQWGHEVVTAQGRSVAASEIPWLRAREVCVHAVDLDRGVSFNALAADFLEALSAEVSEKRGTPFAVEGDLAERVAWLTGRPHRLESVPSVGLWL